MSDSTKHTPTPWRVHHAGSEGSYILPDSGDKREDMKHIALIGGRVQPLDGVNAAHIVRCVNSFDDLLDALKCLSRDEALDDDDPKLGESRTKARKAIQKAEA